jgi:O-antigen ligase
VQLVAQKPIFGWGPLTVTTFDVGSGYEGWSSHNTFLSLLVATGSVGAALYIVAVVRALARGIRSKAAPGVHSSSVRSFALAGAAAYVVNAAAIDMHYFPFPHSLFWLCLGLLVATRSAAKAVCAAGDSPTRQGWQ